MSRYLSMLAIAFVVASTMLVEQSAPDGAGAAAAPDKARLAQVLAAWSTKDPAKAAVFYAKDPGLVFYDVAPRKYSGWPEYAKGTTEMFKTVKTLTLKLGSDADVHQAGNLAWATTSVDGEMVGNDGSRMMLEGRWTSVWEKRGNNWLIVHDHFSIPAPEGPPTAPPATKKP